MAGDRGYLHTLLRLYVLTSSDFLVGKFLPKYLLRVLPHKYKEKSGDKISKIHHDHLQLEFDWLMSEDLMAA